MSYITGRIYFGVRTSTPKHEVCISPGVRGGRSLRGLGAEAGTGVTRYGELSAWAKRDQKAVSFPALLISSC